MNSKKILEMLLSEECNTKIMRNFVFKAIKNTDLNTNLTNSVFIKNYVGGPHEFISLMSTISRNPTNYVLKTPLHWEQFFTKDAYLVNKNVTKCISDLEWKLISGRLLNKWSHNEDLMYKYINKLKEYDGKVDCIDVLFNINEPTNNERNIITKFENHLYNNLDRVENVSVNIKGDVFREHGVYLNSNLLVDTSSNKDKVYNFLKTLKSDPKIDIENIYKSLNLLDKNVTQITFKGDFNDYNPNQLEGTIINYNDNSNVYLPSIYESEHTILSVFYLVIYIAPLVLAGLFIYNYIYKYTLQKSITYKDSSYDWHLDGNIKYTNYTNLINHVSYLLDVIEPYKYSNNIINIYIYLNLNSIDSNDNTYNDNKIRITLSSTKSCLNNNDFLNKINNKILDINENYIDPGVYISGDLEFKIVFKNKQIKEKWQLKKSI